MTAASLRAYVLLLASVLSGSSGLLLTCNPARGEVRNPQNQWDWLQNTYWIVPDRNLPAVLFDPGTSVLAPVSDQTVYHITGSRSGYFWGKNVTEIAGGQVTCSSLVGSVTPQGRVLLSFTVVNSDGSVSQQVGFGEMTLKDGAWTMLNQTTSASFSHWAYMAQSVPGDRSWHSLPGSGLSVQSFLGQCPGNGPKPPRG